jgi:hypothetical protein
MFEASKLKEHMEVVGSDGKHVGTVDHLEGSDQIKLTKSDATSGGQHHVIPTAWVAEIDNRVHLNMPAEQATKQWKAAA